MSDSDPTPPSRSHGRLSISASARPREVVAPLPAPTVWEARVIPLFPEAFPGTLGLSLTGRALELGLWRLTPLPLRAFGQGRHRNVDDTPAGGGAGMVLRADVVDAALRVAQAGLPADRSLWPVVYPSPRGQPFTQGTARTWVAAQGVTLICGRFEGIDQRVLDHHGIEEVSLGDFVLTGGEIAAQAMLDATVRLLPGVLGNADSADEESFSDGLLEHPQFTRPAEWEGRAIPPVLLSGNHAEIARWRRMQSEQLTETRRPDLWAAHRAKGGPGR
ncbi:MAG TPA: tRNA (guanosine(37)-N1)-methyltransferase TrmD [Paracoccaceae bacterium]|nr:tRNA (guanosine(37)-N1)-methyltransferase TrmD [Paracoccaceae bacterium]